VTLLEWRGGKRKRRQIPVKEEEINGTERREIKMKPEKESGKREEEARGTAKKIVVKKTKPSIWRKKIKKAKKEKS